MHAPATAFTRLLAFALALLVAAPLAAQQVSGTISGRALDERDEAVAGAAVTVESAALSVTRTVTANEQGLFTVPNLPPGVYRVTVRAQGFGDFVQDNVKLDVSGTFDLAARLKVGGANETVTVTGDTYQTVNRETANIETLVSGAQVTELALNGRNWAQLVNLAPGTSAVSNDAQQGTSVRIDDTAINGLRRRTAPTIDGISNVDHGSVGTQVNNISVDAIQEFKLVSSPYSAEYGGQAGPAINVATKRGTTEFHGSLFEFFRHDALNAYSWETKQRATPEKPYLRFNNFGGFLGGPVYRSRLFFFGGQEYKRPRTGRTVSEVVPTVAMRGGDFSAFLPAGVPANNTSCTPAGVTQTATSFILCDKSASQTGVAFPGNKIPANKLSPNGKALIGLYPLPNDTTGGRYIAAPVTARDVRQDVLRVDYQVTHGATLFGRYLADTFDSDNPLGSSFDNQLLPIAPDNHVRLGKTAMASYTQVVSPTLVNEFTAAWQRNDQEINYQDERQISRATYGLNFTEIFPANRLNKIPEFSVLGYPQLSGNGLPYKIDAESWEMRDNLTKTWGAHTVKTGFLFIDSFKAENTRVRDGGQITFSSGGDAGNAFRPQDSGHAVRLGRHADERQAVHDARLGRLRLQQPARHGRRSGRGAAARAGARRLLLRHAAGRGLRLQPRRTARIAVGVGRRGQLRRQPGPSPDASPGHQLRAARSRAAEERERRVRQRERGHRAPVPRLQRDPHAGEHGRLKLQLVAGELAEAPHARLHVERGLHVGQGAEQLRRGDFRPARAVRRESGQELREFRPAARAGGQLRLRTAVLRQAAGLRGPRARRLAVVGHHDGAERAACERRRQPRVHVARERLRGQPRPRGRLARRRGRPVA
jgi:hypothetical protein